MTTASGPDREQRLVEEHFHSAAAYWKDVYTQDTLNGAMYRQRRAAVLSFVDRLSLPSSARVLEAGCGAGTTSVALAKRGLQVEALDAIAEMVLLTEQAARADGVATLLTVRQGDVNDMPFPGNWFDLAVAIGVLEWMPSLERTLKELHRVLRPGGWLIANVDNSRALHCLIDPRMNPLMSGAKRYMRRLSERAEWAEPVARPSRCSRTKFDDALRAAGFHKAADCTSGFGPMTMFGIALIPDKLGVHLHCALQRMSERQIPLIRAGGETYLVLAQKIEPNTTGSREIVL